MSPSSWLISGQMPERTECCRGQADLLHAAGGSGHDLLAGRETPGRYCSTTLRRSRRCLAAGVPDLIPCA
jgi:hypothetical protein